MATKGKLYRPSGITQRVGQTIRRIGSPFTIFQLWSELPDVRHLQIGIVLRNKEAQGIIARVGQERYELLTKQFVKNFSPGSISKAVWQVLRKRRHRSLSLSIITLYTARAMKSQDQRIYNSVSMVLCAWTRIGALERTGQCKRYSYRLYDHVTKRPLNTIRQIA